MSDDRPKVPAFTASQHVEMLRLGINPATVEARSFRIRPVREWQREAAYVRDDWDPSFYAVPVIARSDDAFTIILPNGRQFEVATPPGHPLRRERVGR